MSRYNRSTSAGLGYPRWTPAVKALVIACVVAWLLQIVDAGASGGFLTLLLGLTPSLVVSGYVWQLATYIFLHSTGGILHILFNMLGLWMFGSQLESYWGSRQFLKFFFVCGIGAGVLMVLLSLITGSGYNTMTIGASGAVYGILLAFGVLFPDAIIYWIIFPIRAKWFVIILGAIAFYSSLAAVGSGVAHVAHLGGMLIGLIYLRGGRMTGRMQQRYSDWKRARLRRKFDVYYNDRHKDDDPPWRWKN